MHYVLSVLDVRQAYRRTQVSGYVTSVVAHVNQGLDYLHTEEHIDNREIRRIDGSIREFLWVVRHSMNYL